MKVFPQKLTGFLCLVLFASAALAQKAHTLRITIGDGKTPPLQSKAFLLGYYVNQRKVIDSVQAGNVIQLKLSDTLSKGMYSVMLYTDLKDASEKYQRMSFDVIITGGSDLNFSIGVTPSNNFDELTAESGENKAYNDNFKAGKMLEKKEAVLETALQQYPKGDAFYQQLEAQLQKLKQEKLGFADLPCDAQKTPYTCAYLSAVSKSEKKLFEEIDFTDTLLKASPFIPMIVWGYLNETSQDTLLASDAKLQRQKERLDRLAPLLMKDKNVFRLMMKEIGSQYESAGKTDLVLYLNEKYILPYAGAEDAEKLKQKTALLQSLRAGQPAPDIELNVMGFKKKLYDIEAKYVVLLFWDTDCPHCQELSTQLVDFYHRNKSKGLEIVGLALDASEKEWMNYISEHQIDWQNFLDPDGWKSSAAKAYNVHSTPSMFLLDKNKLIVGNYSTLEELKDKIL